MSNLLGLLNLGSSAFLAQNAGLATSARNIANVNTEGYSRQSVDFRSESGAPGGVRAGPSVRAESALLAARERAAAGSGGRADASASATLALESDLVGGGDLSQSLASFFASIGRLAAAPLDDGLRQNVLNEAQALGAQFQNAAGSVAAARADADARIFDVTREASALAQRIADLNRMLGGGVGDPVLSDERELAAKKLAELVGGKSRVDEDGKMRVVLGGGTVLVDGDRAATLETQADPLNASSSRVLVRDGAHVADVTDRLDGGRIAGELAFRDGTARRTAAALDTLAFDVATRVNAVHRGGTGADGAGNRNLFVEPTASAGAAASFAVDPAILADPRRIAAAGAGEGNGGSTNAHALLALRDAKLAGGGTRSFLDEAVKTVSDVGGAAKIAESERKREEARGAGVAAARDALSGVSQEEELARMVAFQRAAQGALQVVATVDELLADLMNRL
jgi:flagellar hook-associated protein 1 FlgK